MTDNEIIKDLEESDIDDIANQMIGELYET